MCSSAVHMLIIAEDAYTYRIVYKPQFCIIYDIICIYFKIYTECDTQPSFVCQRTPKKELFFFCKNCWQKLQKIFVYIENVKNIFHCSVLITFTNNSVLCWFLNGIGSAINPLAVTKPFFGEGLRSLYVQDTKNNKRMSYVKMREISAEF